MCVMEVIARLQDRALCASITCITGIMPSPKGGVIFDHRHNADVSEFRLRILMQRSASSFVISHAV
jgi:hypothetical protein